MPLGLTHPRTRVYLFQPLCERTIARVSYYETIVIGLDKVIISRTFVCCALIC